MCKSRIVSIVITWQEYIIYKEKGYGEYVKEATTPPEWKMSAKSHSSVFNEWQGNLHITGQSAAGPKTTSYIGTVK